MDQCRQIVNRSLVAQVSDHDELLDTTQRILGDQKVPLIVFLFLTSTTFIVSSGEEWLQIKLQVHSLFNSFVFRKCVFSFFIN